MIRILRIYYTKLWPTAYDREQLHNVLERQYADRQCGEVGGGIFHNESGLELHIVKPQKMQAVEDRLQQFMDGDFSTVNSLVQFAQERLDLGAQEPAVDQRSLDSLQKLISFFQVPVFQTEMEHRKTLGQLYVNMVLNTQYFVSLQEVGIGKKEFRGTFHVHPSGLPPAYQDQKISKALQVPAVVIAAPRTYRESGITVYLVHSQGYEELFKGKLPEEL